MALKRFTEISLQSSETVERGEFNGAIVNVCLTKQTVWQITLN